jgi:hypothetical protein
MIDINALKKTVDKNKAGLNERIKNHKQLVWSTLCGQENKVQEYITNVLVTANIKTNSFRMPITEFWGDILPDIEYDYDSSDEALQEFFKQRNINISFTTYHVTKMIKFDW